MTLPNICLFTETYYPVKGGGETQARAVAEGLIARGFSVFVITRRSDAALRKIERYGPVTVYRLPPAGPRNLRKWGLLVTSIPLLLRLRRHYDLIYVSGFRVVGITSILMGRLLGKPCVLKADSLGEMSGAFFTAGLRRLKLSGSSLLFRLFLAWRNSLLRCASAYIAISSEVRSELIRHGIDPGAIRAIPNSVDPDRFRPVDPSSKRAIRARLDIPVTDRVVIYTGRLVSYKGLPLLLYVWREIQARHAHVRLLLVGSGGLDIHNCEDDLKAYVQSNNLQESVTFAGETEHVHEYLQASDIFVFPTESEAFGISLIEAMACGLPSIATSVGGVKDILEHGRNGLVVRPGDFQQLYAALDTLLEDGAFSERLGAQGRRTARERYSTQAIVQQYASLFVRITNMDAPPHDGAPRNGN